LGGKKGDTAQNPVILSKESGEDSTSLSPDINRPARARRKAKVIKARGERLAFFVGDGINLERVQSLIECALVGRMEHVKVTIESLKEYITIHWFPILKYSPRFSYLVNGWIIFHFLSVKDREAIRNTFG